MLIGLGGDEEVEAVLLKIWEYYQTPCGSPAPWKDFVSL